MFKRVRLLAMVLGAAAIAPPAPAQTQCEPRDVIVDRLSDRYSEQLTAGGLTNGDPVTSVVEIWRSEETGTFTVIVTTATGVSCVVAAGTDYFETDPVEQAEGVPS